MKLLAPLHGVEKPLQDADKILVRAVCALDSKPRQYGMKTF